MKPKILSWNVRGLNDPNKRLKVKNLLRDWKADIICLQETKLKFIDRYIIRSLWNCPYAGWTTIVSKGASGCILLMWDKRVVNFMEDYVGEFSLACSFSNVDDDFVWGFAGVYGPNDDSSKKLLWDELAGLCSWWDIPWCIRGDFNITWFPSEQSGVSNMGSAMADFSALLSDLDLMDLPLAGGDFTWSNKRVWSRLDRFVVSLSWETHFPNLCHKRLPRLCSDQFPILLDCGGLQEGCRYFKFENKWLEVDGFVEKIRSWWTSYQLTGSPSFVLAGKLKALKNDLRKWILEIFVHIKDQGDKLFTELQQLDEREADMTLSFGDMTRRIVVLAELEKIHSWRKTRGGKNHGPFG
ncbi:hypothetical protein CIPAW_08G116600 [Carya illinoinensis]|uniref:Endonuclease/exonuclease/phosphatase domain-containing protein n=1 Tax=Carya illinoinensis TaxID=32201 RepID=A0A8T1PVB2_CARIL|nr:hypothetical protein CIPAW_08G116600 [Carya illinoinensis]